MARPLADGLLSDLGQRLGMAGLCLDDAGCCQLLFDQRWLVTLLHLPAPGWLGLHCPVSAAGATDTLPRGTLLAMLQGSFVGRGAGGAGATLCVSPDQRAWLQQVVGIEGSSGERLEQAIEQLLVHAQAWSQRIESGGDDAPASAAPAQWAMQRV
ncbi:MAG TPA: type III secretion system chaperone [Ramlibacter sp.]|nr:type III secretion system chaperone [Ramlibacter sp.]